MATGIRKPGEFCWFNMITPRPEEARAFFARVLGWTYFEMPGLGHGVRVDGHNVGGVFDLDGPNVPTGTVPFIGVMVKVEDADATVEKVEALGGRAVARAFDIGENGRMAACKDPLGAEFSLWEPKRMPGTDVDPMSHGAPSWSEAMTSDVGRATAFYSGLFGWEPEVKPMPGCEYTVFRKGGASIAGMMAIAPEMGPLPPCWMTYFTVGDIDEAAQEALALGATPCTQVLEAPGVGRFCILTSPQGVAFSLIEYERAG